MREVLISVFALGIVAIAIIGLLDFDLMLELWVKVVIGVLFVRFIVTVLRQVTRQRDNHG